jgi:hypothetical protein
MEFGEFLTFIGLKLFNNSLITGLAGANATVKMPKWHVKRESM